MKVADIRRLDKIREIEERIVNCETNILRNPNEILRRVICIMDDSGQLSVCSTFYWLSLLYVQKQKR